MKRVTAATLLFGASAVVLMLEILAGRLMAPYVGVSQETFTGIIGTMLAGIALGAAAGGSLADRRDPRTLIGPTLVLGGALAWASLPILRVLGPRMGTGAPAIVFLTAAAFLAPAAVLSAVAPMVAKLQMESLDESGAVVGRVSAAGTFGALAGTFVTGFVLVAALPTQWVVLLIGAGTIGAGLVLVVRHRSAAKDDALAAIAVVLVSGAGAFSLAPPCERETAYACVRVETDPQRTSGRSLILDRTRHAYVDLEDPKHLELRYARLLASVIDGSTVGPLDVAHLGGGGFTLPSYLRATRPESKSVVLEIDPVLVEVAREQLGFSDEAIDVIVGDARLSLDRLPANGFDVVIGDAFAGSSVPWHLTTIETIRQIDRLLRPGGIYVMNVIDGGRNRYAHAQLATLAEQFRYVAAIVPPGGVPDQRVNQILVGSNEPIGDLQFDPADGMRMTESDLDRVIDGARVLTDSFAPVDQLAKR
jgi:spermidine synthase